MLKSVFRVDFSLFDDLGHSALETETLAPKSRRDQDLSKMNSSALESQDLGLEITTLLRTSFDWGSGSRHMQTIVSD